MLSAVNVLIRYGEMWWCVLTAIADFLKIIHEFRILGKMSTYMRQKCYALLYYNLHVVRSLL